MTCAQASVNLSNLDRDQKEKLFKGETVMLEEKVKDAPWPRLKIYRVIDADTESFAAFFADFERQKDYIPNLIKSKITNGDGSNNIDVSYEMNLPWPIPNAVYLHGHTIKKLGQDHFQISWYVVESSVAQKVIGQSDFVKFKDKTLWYYENFTLPKSSLAGLFEGSMKVDTKASLDATLEAFRKDKNDNPAKLQKSLTLWLKRFLDSTK